LREAAQAATIPRFFAIAGRAGPTRKEFPMKIALRPALAVAVVLALVAPLASAAVDKLTTDKDKASYMVGMDIAQGLQQVKEEIDTTIMLQALETSLKGGKTLLTAEEAAQVRTEFSKKLQAEMQAKQKVSAEKNKGEGDKFLAENKKKAGVKVTPSGLQYIVLKQGTGKKPTANDQVKVHYVGTLIDGTKFDSSYDRGQPAQFPLNGVIKGWTEALQLMTVGSKYKLFIPPDLAYGDQDPPGPIGPNATLIFEVELVEVLN
jgi:FKBP-type peptidyl-prolyl cis-trans isomerase